VDKIVVEYTSGEADAVLKLYDLAVRQGGLAVAEAAAVLSKKLQDAAKTKELNNGNADHLPHQHSGKRQQELHSK
jgi:hypothetical protein